MVSIGQGFPRKIRTIHKYVERVNRTTGTTADLYFFTCNGMYDPNITGTGHQPLYFDQMSAIYNHYTVFKSTCTFELVNSTVSLLVSHTIEDDTTGATDFQAAEMSTSRVVTHLATATKSTKLTRSWVAKQVFGGDIYDNIELSGSPASNPTDMQYFVLSPMAMDGVSTYTYSFLVTIVYEAVWDELKTIAAS